MACIPSLGGMSSLMLAKTRRAGKLSVDIRGWETWIECCGVACRPSCSLHLVWSLHSSGSIGSQIEPSSLHLLPEILRSLRMLLPTSDIKAFEIQ